MGNEKNGHSRTAMVNRALVEYLLWSEEKEVVVHKVESPTRDNIFVSVPGPAKEKGREKDQYGPQWRMFIEMQEGKDG
jgi:hypothetical protein